MVLTLLFSWGFDYNVAKTKKDIQPLATIRNFLDRSSKKGEVPSSFKIRSVGAELFHADGEMT
jgi:hypothetical protein